jgi:TonB family protein
MSTTCIVVNPRLGLLPEAAGYRKSVAVSAVVNLTLLAIVIWIGMTARKVLELHQFDQIKLIFPTELPPPPMKMKLPPPPRIDPPKVDPPKLDPPKINLPKPEEPKPEKIQMESKVKLPPVKAAQPQIILAPQPKAALAAAAMPAENANVKPSTAPVHLGETFGVTPNPNATRAATVPAIGNPYGGMNGPSVAPHGVVGSTGLGKSTTRSGSNIGTVGQVARAGIPGGNGTAETGGYGGGHVASAGIPQMQKAAVQRPSAPAEVQSTTLEVLSKPPVQYTTEAKQLRVQGDVVLQVTFTAGGRVIVQGILHSLGHGLDEEARRVAQQIRFRPATRNGQAVDLTTNITITFQLA